MSPIFKSITTSEELGSPSNSDNLDAPGSNLACENFFMFRTELDFNVETVPLERSKTNLASSPVVTV